MAVVSDVARFRADDPDALVEASLACPLCLGGDSVRWRTWLEDWEEAVDCRCVGCGARWRVYLEPEQALRLTLLRTAHGG